MNRDIQIRLKILTMVRIRNRDRNAVPGANASKWAGSQIDGTSGVQFHSGNPWNYMGGVTELCSVSKFCMRATPFDPCATHMRLPSSISTCRLAFETPSQHQT